MHAILWTPTSVMGDLGLTLRAAAISWSWLTSSVMDRRSSGFTFSIDPGQQQEKEKKEEGKEWSKMQMTGVQKGFIVSETATLQR